MLTGQQLSPAAAPMHQGIQALPTPRDSLVSEVDLYRDMMSQNTIYTLQDSKYE